jgi:hypothetical protein
MLGIAESARALGSSRVQQVRKHLQDSRRLLHRLRSVPNAVEGWLEKPDVELWRWAVMHVTDEKTMLVCNGQ